MPKLQNRFLVSATLARGKGWVQIHPGAVRQVDTGRTIPRQVSKPGATSLRFRLRSDLATYLLLSKLISSVSPHRELTEASGPFVLLYHGIYSLDSKEPVKFGKIVGK